MTNDKLTNDKLTNALKKYADNAVTRFDELEFPASITVFIETDSKNIQTSSLRSVDTNSIVINTVTRHINHLVNDKDFLQALQHALETK